MARTRPWAARLARAEHRRARWPEQRVAMAAAAVVLELGEAPWAGIACWSGRAQRWATFTVPVAYAARYDTHVRPVMPGNPVSLQAVRAVAAARAGYADHDTGRNSRPSNARLAADAGYSVRTVQRADTALRLLGVATEVLRGRQRTRAERFASWRLGDRGRGWASVWALHDHRLLQRVIHKPGLLSPHPRSGPVREKNSSKNVVTTATGSPPGHRPPGGRRRRQPRPDNAALLLAGGWIRDPHSPPWARRYPTPSPWGYILAGPARHGWTPRDVNQLISDWLGTGHRFPESPRKPIGLLGAILAWHGAERLDERPAAADVAREEAEEHARREELAQRQAERDHDRLARQAGRAALAGPGHRAARAALADLARRAHHRPEGTR